MKREDSVLEYLREKWDRRLRDRVNARVECMNKSKWRLSVVATPLREFPGTGFRVD